MQIHLRLFATLRAHTPDNAEAFTVAAGATVKDIVAQLKIPPKEAKLIFINGVRMDMATPLADGDRVGIFPPVGGG